MPEIASSYLLQAAIGRQRAAELFFTAEWIDAARAVETGIAARSFADDALLDSTLAKAKEIAATICENGPLAVEAILKTLHETDGMGEAEALAYEQSYGQAVFGSEDAREGPRAFAEKRKPEFKRR